MIPYVSASQQIAQAQLFTLLWMLPTVALVFGVSYLPKRMQQAIYLAVAGAVVLDCCWYIPQCQDWFFYILNPICWG